MIFIAYYIELSDKDTLFYTHDRLTDDEKLRLKQAFLNCGGISLREYATNNKRFIISKWDFMTGYDNWIKHPDAQSYITARNAHNTSNGIKSDYITVLPESEV